MLKNAKVVRKFMCDINIKAVFINFKLLSTRHHIDFVSKSCIGNLCFRQIKNLTTRIHFYLRQQIVEKLTFDP